IDPETFKLLVGIVNENHHWTLVVIYPLEKRTVFLNSLGESQKDLKRSLEATRAFMRSKGMKVSRWKCDTVQHAMQQDVVSCGVFALKFAECILENKNLNFPSTAEAVNTMRLNISSTVLSESDSVENICRHCGSEDTEDLW
uniref:Ubiquitin-like protease family profile domain-containing protein n=1 Tax=Poecilia formosa TaxID=48698 RepID=A0A096LXE3_POEFO